MVTENLSEGVECPSVRAVTFTQTMRWKGNHEIFEPCNIANPQIDLHLKDKLFILTHDSVTVSSL